MAHQSAQSLVRRQHWVIARRQLLALGCTKDWIKHAVAAKRLFPIHVGVYAVGRRELTQEGYFIAAVLACGENAFLSHESAATSHPRRPGIKVHRRRLDGPHLERAVNEAINKDLTDPEKLQKAVTSGKLCQLLDRDTFTVTDTELEQRLVPIARAAGLPKALTQVEVNG